ncbi:MAG: hypothetical protein JW774_02470 [Candidatus Aureabacteria bacterium]|nr:hypothetical protein [Candidatus Auribacterota bacterium]
MSANGFFFQLSVASFSPEDVMQEIREEIKTRQALGVYDHADLSRVLSLELKDMKGTDHALEYYLKAIRRSWAVDINDFDIPSKGGTLTQQLVLLKKIIWKCLKFYTYRLFSQQREFNSQLSNTLIAMHKDYEKKIRELEKKIKMLN